MPSAFVPPTPEEVRAYCLKAGISFDAARFCDYNAARGWLVGNRPMTDWRAAARVWASRGDLPSVSGTSSPTGKLLSHQKYQQRTYTNNFNALDQMMEQFFREQEAGKNDEEAGLVPP